MSKSDIKNTIKTIKKILHFYLPEYIVSFYIPSFHQDVK